MINMAKSSLLSEIGLSKKIIYAGKGDISDFPDGTKATFHFQTKRSDADVDDAPIDDSCKAGKPMELIFGKQFKLPVWEQCLKTMKCGEVAEFTISKSLVDSYPLVSKSYRQYAGLTKNTETSSHCCGMMALKDGLGHPDLDNLMKNPCDLKFTFELVKVEIPGEYEKESWAMNPEEKLESVPKLREEGNALYRNKQLKLAADKYAEALNRLEQLLLREKPGEEEWVELEKMKIPLLLNFSQCKLLEKEYYPVIEHTTTVLQKEPDNVKALYRRAKASLGAWDPKAARADFLRVMELDSSLKPAVMKELKQLEEAEKRKDEEDKMKLQGKIF